MTQLSPEAAAQVMRRLDPAYTPPGSDIQVPSNWMSEAIRLLEGMRCHLTGQGRYMERQELIDGIDKLIGPWKPMCDCGAKRRPECPGQWEPGCDLGANEAHVRAAPASAAVDLALGFEYVKVQNIGGGLKNRLTQAQYDNLSPFGKTMYRRIVP